MIHHFDDIGLFFCNEDATPETCVNEFIFVSHLEIGFALAGSCLYGDCEAFI